MRKKLLHKYFQKEVSCKEIEEVVDWFEKSEKNRLSFLSERKLWDATTLLEEKRTKKRFSINGWTWQVAAVAVLFLLSLGIWNLTSPYSDSLQTIQVPVGQRVNLILADGTSVWLNSNSKLTYPVEFGRRKREVTVDGEAYFEVAHNKKRPFIVNTEKYEVKVLGTTFNIHAYSEYNIFETALLEGSVKIHDKANNKNLLLSPDERALEVDGKLKKVVGLNSNGYAWKNGILTFNDEPINHVIQQLCAYYDKKIYLNNDKYQDYRCTTKFLYNDGLDYILNILQRDLHYEILKDSINDIIILQ